MKNGEEKGDVHSSDTSTKIRLMSHHKEMEKSG